MRSQLVFVALALCGCRSGTPAEPPPDSRPLVRGLASYERTQVAPEALRGISGMAQDDAGTLWLVGERDQRLFSVFLEKGRIEIGPGIPIEGVPEGLDIESLAFLEQHTPVFGTESLVPGRTSDAIFVGSLTAERVTIKESLPFEYQPFGIQPPPNKGVEALCATGGALLAGAEPVITDGKRRYAPLLRLDPVGHRRSTHRLLLSSEEGKLSAFACRPMPGGMEVVGIERHYGTSRLLYFQLPMIGGPEEIEPMVIFDMAALFDGDPPNFEGVALLGDRDLLLVSDNDYAGKLVPTELVRLVLEADPGSGGYRGMSQ